MPTIDDFIAVANRDYQTGSKDVKYHLADLIPDVIDTEDATQFFVSPTQAHLWDDPTVQTNYVFSKWSLYQYCKRLSPVQAKLDYKYLQACSPQLALRQLKFWSRVFEEREVLLRIQKTPGGQSRVRAALTGLHQPIDAVPVATKLKPMLKDREIEFVVTPQRWSFKFWEDMSASGQQRFDVGFRVMGSEVGAASAVRMDTLMQFRTDRGQVTLPILNDGKPLARIGYTGNGAAQLGRLAAATQQGVQRVEQATEAVMEREKEAIKYPIDEFLDIVYLHRLPSTLNGMAVEHEKMFAPIKTKLDMSLFLGRLAQESVGRAQSRLEFSAGVYLLTGRAKMNRNRNQEDLADDESDV
jgi:hypothetical protein